MLTGHYNTAAAPRPSRATLTASCLAPCRTTDLSVDEYVFAAEPSAKQQQLTDKRPAAVAKGIASSAGVSGDDSRPRRSREAIDAGMARFAEGGYREAIKLFQMALELPGSGVMRAAGRPKE